MQCVNEVRQCGVLMQCVNDARQCGALMMRVQTYQRVEGRVGADSSHLVDGLEGQQVLVVVGAAQGAAGAAAGAQVSRRKVHWTACRKKKQVYESCDPSRDV